jgi:methionyl aminopeptidase
MRKSCKILAELFLDVEKYIKEGITTLEIDKIIEDFILSKNAKPAFKNYEVDKNRPPFPNVSCISINDEIVHGIPSNRKIINGDIVTVDVGLLFDDYYADAARTYSIGELIPQKKRLISVTQEAFFYSLDFIRDGFFVKDFSLAIQNFIESKGFSVVKDLGGHGVGKKLHEYPYIPNYYQKDYLVKFEEGMRIAIEPMVNYGSSKTKVAKNKWTYLTADGKPSAHYENTILVTKSKPEILTLL